MVLSPLSELVERIRSDMNLTVEVPGFDPMNGNEQARFLFVLEAPEAKAVKTGCISFDNPDQTARNFKAHLTGAGIERADIAIWNIVPWYLGNQEGTRIRAATAADTKQGLKYLSAVIDSMPKLHAIVLVGGAARQAHVHLSSHHQRSHFELPPPIAQGTQHGQKRDSRKHCSVPSHARRREIVAKPARRGKESMSRLASAYSGCASR